MVLSRGGGDKFCGKIGRGDGARGTHSRGKEEIVGADERGVVDAGMDTGNDQVGG